MATLTYLGKKKNYGPLLLPWMTEQIKFDKNGFAKGIDDMLALAIESECPTLFRAGSIKGAIEEVPFVSIDEVPPVIDEELITVQKVNGKSNKEV
jgi:hypothetical protein